MAKNRPNPLSDLSKSVQSSKPVEGQVEDQVEESTDNSAVESTTDTQRDDWTELLNDEALPEPLKITPRELYFETFRASIAATIVACDGLPGVASRQQYARSLIQRAFVMCDMVIEEYNKLHRS